MAKYQLETLIRDKSIRSTLEKSLKNDGRLSYSDVQAILSSALDGDGVTPQEDADLRKILANAKSLDPRSKRLIENFLKQHYRPILPQKPTTSGQLTANFNISEFACKDGTAVPASLAANVKALATNLQVLRDTIGKSIKINSGYRTLAHNTSVGGKPQSLHLVAKAADIVINGKSPATVKKEIEALIKAGKMTEGGIGLYKSFVHYDIRGTKQRW